MQWRDVLFRIGLWRGVRVQPPAGLILCRLNSDSPLTQVYEAEVNDEHPVGQWLLEECEGPWAVRMHRPLSRREGYIAFARVTDAVTFRLLMA